jgi:hypothetical protein
MSRLSGHVSEDGINRDPFPVGLGLPRFDGQGWCEVGSRYLYVGGGVG